MKKSSLRSRMLFQYVALVIVCMIVLPLIISYMMTAQIRRYAKERYNEDVQNMISFAQTAYSQSGQWDKHSLAFAVRDKGMRWPIVKAAIADENGKILRDYRPAPRMGPPKNIDQHRQKKDEKRIIQLLKSPREERHDIMSGGKKVGELVLYALPFENSREGEIISSFMKTMACGVVIMIFVVVLIAIITTNTIIKPILRTAGRAEEISRGEFGCPDSDSGSNIKEIDALVASVEKLGLDLEEQEKLRKRLMSDIAHELRNPVTVVKSHLEAFIDGVWEPTPERVQLTLSEVDRLSKLISEVEKLTTIERAGNNMAVSITDLSSLTIKAVDSFAPMFASRGVAVEADIEELVMAAVDPSKIRQVEENLISNAIRYTDKGGVVKVTLKKSGENAVVCVKDSGIGISAADLPNIFERFYRTDKSRTRESGGLGIGLAIVKAIVDAHGGAIKAESKDGQGSTFTVTLPLKNADLIKNAD